jgi:hypothetical protein
MKSTVLKKIPTALPTFREYFLEGSTSADRTFRPAMLARPIDRHFHQSMARSLVSGKTISATSAVAKATPTGYQRPA